MKNNKQFFFTILVFVLALIALLSILFVIYKQTSKRTGEPIPTPLPDQEIPNMMISFNPNILTVSSGSTFSANIDFDSYGNPVNSLTVALSYDPSELTNVRLTPIKDTNSVLSYSFNLIAGNQENDPSTGDIVQTFVIPKSIPAPKGRGTVAKVTGRLKPGIQSAIVRITNNSTASSSTVERVVLGKINLEINP